MVFLQLIELKKQQFTGIVRVKAIAASNQIEWKIYFCLGKLIWSEGGYHPHRACRRHLLKYCSQIDLDQINVRISDEFKCKEYHLLLVLLQRQLIQQEATSQIITNQITEVFFDLLQQEEIQPLYLEQKEVSASSLLKYGLKMSVAMLEVESIFLQAQKLWSVWKQNGLVSYFPNTAPRIRDRQQLQQEVSPTVYQNFVRLLDGKRTLRDLAVEMNKDVLKLTASLAPYINKGLLELIEVADREPLPALVNSCESNPLVSDDRLLIACVDDSPQVCRMMEQIINKANYRFVGIQQPLQAVPTLIGAKPDLIFLDVGMPIMNGYELCGQIRKVSKLKELPVVFLTGNDGIVDRVKAKVVGASDFVAKPIEVEKILKTIDKFTRFQATAVAV